MVSCQTKKIAENPIQKYLGMENPYTEMNRSKTEIYGFGDKDGALRDSVIMCYELLDKNDLKLRPIISQLVKKNPENEELLFINAKNHMNQANYARAIEIFSELSRSENYDIMDQSRYYFALIVTYIDNDDKQGISIFKKISSDRNSEFKHHAKDILSYL